MDEYELFQERFDKLTVDELERKHMCPVCGKHEFPRMGCGFECPICGWEDSIIQLLVPTKGGIDNRMSLNMARERYKKGEKKF